MVHCKRWVQNLCMVTHPIIYLYMIYADIFPPIVFDIYVKITWYHPYHCFYHVYILFSQPVFPIIFLYDTPNLFESYFTSLEFTFNKSFDCRTILSHDSVYSMIVNNICSSFIKKKLHTVLNYYCSQLIIQNIVNSFHCNHHKIIIFIFPTDSFYIVFQYFISKTFSK